MEKYLELLRAGESEPKIIDPATVVTAAWTWYKCQFGCDNYGRNHCCPPETPDHDRTRAILDSYQTAILFCCHHWGGYRPGRQGGAGAVFGRLLQGHCLWERPLQAMSDL